MIQNDSMFLALNDNIYLVQGKVYSCIYDFNTLKLYQVDKELADLIDKINCDYVTLDDMSEEYKEFIGELLEHKILKLTNYKRINSIEECVLGEKKIEFAWIEITNKCNLKCIHCYNESDVSCCNEMSLDDFKGIVDFLLKINVGKIQIIGGEPFVVGSKLKDMLDYVVEKFEYIEIFTNGTLVTNEWINYLKENNIRVALSVYSYNEEEHDKVTQCAGSLRKTNITIQKLHDSDIKYRVCNTLMKNIVLGDINTDLYRLNPRKDVVRMSGRGNLGLISEEQLRIKLITKDKFTKPLNLNLSRRMITGHNCFSNKIYISADKTVYPCVMERRINHGVIKDSNGIEFSKKILNLNKDFINECKDCEYRYTCFDCRPDSLTENIYEKPWYCTYNPEQGRWEDEDKFILKLKEWMSV